MPDIDEMFRGVRDALTARRVYGERSRGRG